MSFGSRKYLSTLGSLALVLGVWVLGAAVSSPAMAQTICNSSLVVNFPNGDNLNRVVGQTVRMSITVTNGPSQDAGFDDNQVFSLVDFFPSCLSVLGGVCTVDGGATPGAPPPIQYNGNLSQGTCPSLPVVNAADPFDIEFSFVPPYDFANNAGCTFSFDVVVNEPGANGTPANIQQLATTDGVCGSSLTSAQAGSAAITLTCPVCDDGNSCNGVETCDATTAQCVPGTPLNCNDFNACTDDACNPASGCVNVPRPPSACDDSNACTDDTCNPASGCVNVPKPPSFCDDSNGCTDDVCNPASGCVNTPKPPSFCDDGNGCTDDACIPATGGCSNVPKPPSFCDDDNVCTDDACVPATGGCSNEPKPPSFCDDNDQCTEDTCDPQDGCVNEPADPLPAGCGDAICRTPGFWGTHAGVEKNNSINITEAVIDCVDGNCANHTANDFLLICGEKIDSPDSNPADGTTDWNDASSSTEAMCMTVKGFPRIQLARHLTAAALNCIISGGGADCAGTGIYSTVFATCNSRCTSGTATKAELTQCIGALDCLNNGNNIVNGACEPGGVENCHTRPLVNEDLGLDFDPPGPAGSSVACNNANLSICAVVGPTEGPPFDANHCSTDSLP